MRERLSWTLALAVIGALLLAPAALGKVVELHNFDSSFDGSDAVGAGPLSEGSLQKLDVDKASGSVYVATGGRFYKFDSAGVSQPFSAVEPNTVLSQQFGELGDLEVDNSGTASQGRIYAFPEYGPINAYDPSGAPTSTPGWPISSGIGDTCGAAVAENGNFLRGEYPSTIYEYTPEGSLIRTIPIPGGPLCDIEVDSQGNFYLPIPYSGGAIDKYDTNGVFQYQLDPGPSTAVAIDRSNDDVFVDDGDHVSHYTSGGQLVETFGTAGGSYPGLSGSRGIGVNSNTHAVYVNSSPGRVDIFQSTGLVTIANVTTEAASGLTRSSATLNGVVNADNIDTTSCRFEYGKTSEPGYPATAPCAEGNVFTGSADNPVTAALTGLTGGTEYRYRLVVGNANGDSAGATRSFTTVSAVKDTTALEPTNVTRTTATINGSFDADGFATSYWFEWGESSNFDHKVPLPAPPGEDVGTPVGTFEVHQNISGLTKNDFYQYRLVAKNALGETTSAPVGFSTVGNVKGVKTLEPSGISYTTATFHGELDPDGFATNYWFEYAKEGFGFEFKVPLPAPPGASAGSAPGVIEVEVPVTGLEPGTGYYVHLVAENELGRTESIQTPFFETTQAVAGVTTNPATDVHLQSAVLHGSLEPQGTPTKYWFEYGPSVAYGGYAPAPPPGADAGSGNGTAQLEAPIDELEAGVEYHYRLVAENLHGKSFGADATFAANDVPEIRNDTVSQVNTDGAVIQAEINANALNTTYHFEYGSEPCSLSACESAPTGSLFNNTTYKPVFFQKTGFQPGETIYFRVVATNSRGTVVGEDRHFTTYAVDSGVDKCKNSQVRQQTASALLLDCRAYELVSAANAGGSDVESDLIPGEEPLPAYPEADDRVLYSIHNGMVPGVAGTPTNFGRDPYVATRDDETGWTTRYVGLPANGMTQVGAFGSPLLGADAQLDTFAFGGTGICDPCFSDGSTNVPVRLANGSLVKGMAGDLNPAADSTQYVATPLSADGSHFVFGSDAPFESGGSASGSIYDRDLATGKTQVVSTLPSGTAIPGGEVGELDISSDGSRIVVGKAVSTDAKGNTLWQPYLHLGGTADSIELAPGSTSGVSFAGMTADGQRIFFTTKDPLLGGDTDNSADLYEAEVGAGDTTATLSLLSGGGGDACDPAANADGNNWNAVGAASADSCGVVAVGGGGGVAQDNGAAFFLSPEALSGEGVEDEPNLYVVVPGGSPHLVATLEPDNPLVRDSVADAATHRYGDFQLTANGAFAAFDSGRDLTDFKALGHSEIFRYDVADEQLACPSCAPSGAAPITDTSLPQYGLAVTDDGRVFFSSAESFALRDTNEVKDAYEWSAVDGPPQLQLISTGTSLEDSGMLSVTPDGQDALFFTRQVLVHEDGNGSTVKLYDAREGGGFLYDPPPHPCAASDECHGAGSPNPGPPNINTQTGSGVTPAAQKPTEEKCKKGFVKRNGKCKKKPKKHKKQKQHHKRGGRR